MLETSASFSFLFDIKVSFFGLVEVNFLNGNEETVCLTF